MNNGFFEETELTNFGDCDAYKDNITGSLLEAQVPFIVKFAQDIVPQKSASLDCGLYVATFVEYLSDQIEISFVDFRHEYLRKRYGALMWS
uniref:Ulp1 protease family, C-terminal catalytic domain containing protein n=1 Tax=Solanum tuberosum TaxID=4113 RepID=M1DMZ1_SOLTU